MARFVCTKPPFPLLALMGFVIIGSMRTNTRSPMKVVLLLGILFFLAGVAVAMLPPMVQGRQTAVSSLTPLTFTQLQETAVGTTILLEGNVSTDNLQQDGLVAYNSYRRSGGETVHIGSHTPPFAVQIPGGLVYIQNTTYQLARTSHNIRSGNLEYSGLARHDPIVIIGTVANPSKAPTINANTIAFGTQADQLAEVARANQLWVWTGGIVGAIGLALFILAFILWLNQP